jgi:hypothetical protein
LASIHYHTIGTGRRREKKREVDVFGPLPRSVVLTRLSVSEMSCSFFVGFLVCCGVLWCVVVCLSDVGLARGLFIHPQT